MHEAQFSLIERKGEYKKLLLMENNYAIHLKGFLKSDSHLPKNSFIRFNASPLKMIKVAFITS